MTQGNPVCIRARMNSQPKVLLCELQKWLKIDKVGWLSTNHSASQRVHSYSASARLRGQLRLKQHESSSLQSTAKSSRIQIPTLRSLKSGCFLALHGLFEPDHLVASTRPAVNTNFTGSPKAAPKHHQRARRLQSLRISLGSATHPAKQAW